MVAQSMARSDVAPHGGGRARRQTAVWADVHAGLRLLALLSTGIMAGFFFAFSVLVMPGLDRVDAAVGVAAMQAVNAAVDNVAFEAAFAAAPILCLAVIASAALRRTGWLAALGALVYLVGVLGVTVALNIPLNDELDRVVPTSPGAAAMADYLVEWTRWNHVRTISGTLAFALVGASLLRGPRVDGSTGGASA